MVTRAYAGIGSRETPPHICVWMTEVAKVLDAHGWTLRSGGAQGADSAFEAGATWNREIYLPWDGYNGKHGGATMPVHPDWAALALAARYHPAWRHLSPSAQKMMARNGYQVLGPNLDDPVAFVMCWTLGGHGGGGTGQALRIAKDKGIPILDFGGMHWDDTAPVTRGFLQRFDGSAAESFAATSFQPTTGRVS